MDVSLLKDIENLKFLDVSQNKGIKGYEKCKAVIEIKLNDCDIKSVENLNEMISLNSIDLSENKGIIDLEKLNLKNIIALYLARCDLKNINNITNGGDYYKLDLSYNDLTSVSFINESINCIEILDLSGNKVIKDYSNLNNINIYQLDLEDCGIEDLSILPTKNENITVLNLKKNKVSNQFQQLKDMKNLRFIKLAECNLTDVSKLSEIKSLKNLDLSGNGELSGKLEFEELYYMFLSNCKLGNEFDFSGINTIYNLNLEGSNVDLSKLTGNIQYISLGEISKEQADKIPENIEMYDADIYDKLIIPNNEEDLYLYTSELPGIIYEIDTQTIETHHTPFKLNLNNVNEIMCRNEMQNIVYKIYKSDQAEIKNLRLIKYANENRFKKVDDVNFLGMKIECGYGNGIYKDVQNYSVELDKEKMYNGEHTININYNGINCYTKIYIVNEDNNIVLKFKDKKLYEANKDIFDGEPIYIEDEKLEICITPYQVEHRNYAYVPYESLEDIDALKPLNNRIIEIIFSENTDANAKITEEHIQKLREHKNLKSLIILDESGKRKIEDIIVKQDYFDINFISNTNMDFDYESESKDNDLFDKLETDDNNLPDELENDKQNIDISNLQDELKFEDDKLFKQFINKLNSLSYTKYKADYEKKSITLDIEDFDKAMDGGWSNIELPYESLYDIKALSQLDFEEITIVFSNNTSKNTKVLEKDINNLLEFKKLKQLILQDDSGERTKEDVIEEVVFKQNKFNVYLTKNNTFYSIYTVE